MYRYTWQNRKPEFGPTVIQSEKVVKEKISLDNLN